jgi:hypothetical protein
VFASIAGRGWCLDAVSRPAVFAGLFGKLVAGYAYAATGAEGEPSTADQALNRYRKRAGG